MSAISRFLLRLNTFSPLKVKLCCATVRTRRPAFYNLLIGTYGSRINANCEPAHEVQARLNG